MTRSIEFHGGVTGIARRPRRTQKMADEAVTPKADGLSNSDVICALGMRDRDSTWLDEIPDGNDHGIDAVRYAMMGDVLRG